MRAALKLKDIRPQDGDQRGAFEELSFQLFARNFSCGGTPIRRHGAGGDAGLEGMIVDAQSRVSVGLQAKFFNEKLESTQWKDLDDSIRTALADNAKDGILREIVVTLPRNLTQAQFGKWMTWCREWDTETVRLAYPHAVNFTLWDESHLRGLLLKTSNRGLLLHYFEFPDFNAAHCRHRSAATIAGLGDRYLPELHTPTDAEDKLHTFLRSERCRQQFLAQTRQNVRSRAGFHADEHALPEGLRDAAAKAESEWERVIPLFGDGISLPDSFSTLAAALEKAAEALMPLMQGLNALLLPREPRSNDNHNAPRSRGPHEETLRRLDQCESNLRSLAWYLRENALADHPYLLLTGEPGTGKTHVLAEICSRYQEQGGVVLFVEGAKFSTDDLPWSQFLRWAGFAGHCPRDLIEMLSAMAASSSLPALICIDALNETPNRSLWRKNLLDFAAAIRGEDHVKLLVSCRSDYLEQTLPAILRDHCAVGWSFAEHLGLGIEVFEAFPKYVAAYDVHWRGLPPLVQEFRHPLFLRIFCDAYAGRTPHAGSLSLGTILRHFTQRKAELLGERIDCDPSRVLDALRDLAERIHSAQTLHISERDARTICERHHAPTETSRSLYRALLSEGVLAEFPGNADALGTSQLVRFTYERVWDYFISLHLLPVGMPLSVAFAAKLRNKHWRWENPGLVSLLNVRFPEEGHGELCDSIAPDGNVDTDDLEHFLRSLPWRTHESVSARTSELFEKATGGGAIENSFDHIVPLAPNPLHPWNADWLHERLAALPIAERDRNWTFWVNEQLFYLHEDSPLRELLIWAERARLDMLADEHRFLLATILSWCASTTVVDGRKRLAAAITRLLVGRLHVAARLVGRFLPVDDPYVREWVLLAAAGAAQHASEGDLHLAELARVVHTGVFAGKSVEPHLLIRHYAAEVCQQATAKGMLPSDIGQSSFATPFRSRWPKIWSEHQCDEKEESADHLYGFFESVVPNVDGARYGDWGRYVMQSHVSQFLPQKLSERIKPERQGFRLRFDSKIARRYVIQRAFELGWDPLQPDILPNISYGGRQRSNVERLSKKYQWVALYEFLGFLSDHYHFHDYDDPKATFRSARQLIGSALLDPFVIEPLPVRLESTWRFIRPSSPWWRGRLDPLPRPLSIAQQREAASGRDTFHPEVLFALNDGQDDWLTLSAFHEWDEPLPFWTEGESSPRVDIETAIQSYLVTQDKATQLLRNLSERDFERHSSVWLQEPDFDQPMSTLRTFPFQQEQLRRRCALDEAWGTESWRTGASSTTCRCAPDEEKHRTPSGSMPSPQLAELGNLRWLGRAFDFAPAGESTPLVCHVGEGFRGACIAHRKSLLNWLGASGKRLVWRCYIQKFLHNNSRDQNHMRAYWSTFILQPTGEIVHFGGATCTFPHGPGPEEPLPWTERTRSSK